MGSYCGRISDVHTAHIARGEVNGYQLRATLDFLLHEVGVDVLPTEWKHSGTRVERKLFVEYMLGALVYRVQVQLEQDGRWHYYANTHRQHDHKSGMTVKCECLEECFTTVLAWSMAQHISMLVGCARLDAADMSSL